MRILYVGDATPDTRCAQRARALEELGHDLQWVPFVPTHEHSGIVPRSSIYARVRHRLGWPLDTEGANAAVLAALEQRPFDVLWVEKAPCLHASTLRRSRALQPDLALSFFSEDDLASRVHRSHPMTAAFAEYDLVVTTKRRNLTEGTLARLGARNVHFEAKTFDPARHRPLPLGELDRQRLGAQAGFVGTYELARAEGCLHLAEAGLTVRVFGNGWERCELEHPNLLIERRPVSGDVYVRALLATPLQLGFLRKQVDDRHTDRSVEIPACGAFLLAERSDEHLELFAEGREAAYFDDHAELRERARFYLNHPELRAAIARAGRVRCLRSDYSHHGACRRILERALEAAGRSAEDARPRLASHEVSVRRAA
jgi:spore maturation protein CgeB